MSTDEIRPEPTAPFAQRVADDHALVSHPTDEFHAGERIHVHRCACGHPLPSRDTERVHASHLVEAAVHDAATAAVAAVLSVERADDSRMSKLFFEAGFEQAIDDTVGVLRTLFDVPDPLAEVLPDAA